MSTEERLGSTKTQEEVKAASTSPERLLEHYRQMLLVRTFEEACQRDFRQGKIGGYLHVYTGEEAVAVGFLDVYTEGDKVITAYRDPLMRSCGPRPHWDYVSWWLFAAFDTAGEFSGELSYWSLQP